MQPPPPDAFGSPPNPSPVRPLAPDARIGATQRQPHSVFVRQCSASAEQQLRHVSMAAHRCPEQRCPPALRGSHFDTHMIPVAASSPWLGCGAPPVKESPLAAPLCSPCLSPRGRRRGPGAALSQLRCRTSQPKRAVSSHPATHRALSHSEAGSAAGEAERWLQCPKASAFWSSRLPLGRKDAAPQRGVLSSALTLPRASISAPLSSSMRAIAMFPPLHAHTRAVHAFCAGGGNFAKTKETHEMCVKLPTHSRCGSRPCLRCRDAQPSRGSPCRRSQ